MAGTVLVGTDGSEAARTAVDWAAAEAGRLDARLVVCTVANDDMLAEAGLWTSPQVVRRRAEEVTGAAVRRARDAAPGVAVRERVLLGDAVEELRSASGTIDLLVVGCRGLGAFAGLLLGSVSERVALHASCPVVVVRGDPAHWDGPVLLGVADDPNAGRAADYAFAAAERRGTELVLFTAVPPIWAGPTSTESGNGLQGAIRKMQDEAVRSAVEAHPGVRVVSRTVAGAAARSLIEGSRGCGLVVLGTRAHRGSGLLGSVTGHVLRHAYCPVAVVHG